MPTPTLYAITDETLLDQSVFIEKTHQALEAGIKWIQYRDKSKNAHKRLDQASALLSLCQQFDAQLIINDDVWLAQKIEAHGVHLGQSDGSIREAREILGKNAIIGSTCHDSLELAASAKEQGASYVAFGRFFTSKTKPYASVAPLSLLSEAKQIGLPVIAIGGITPENGKQLLDAGAHTLAVCHNLFAVKDIHHAVAMFNRLCEVQT